MAVSFETIGNGELNAMFHNARMQVGRNIMDPNMDPEAARKITIEITFKPKKGGAIDLDYKVTPKLAGMKKSGTTILIGQDAKTGRIEMNEYGNNLPGYQVVAGEDRVMPEEELAGEGRGFDPETGEIIEPQPYQKPIDLRKII